MPHLVPVNTLILLHDTNISGDLNAVAIQPSRDAKDDTSFGSTSRTRVIGLADAQIDLKGFWDIGAGEIDPVVWNRLSTAGGVLTIVPEGIPGSLSAAFAPGTDLAKVAYSCAPTFSSVQKSLEIGEIAGYAATAQAGTLARGKLMLAGSVSTTTGSAASLFGAVPAGKRLYMASHVISGSGLVEIAAVSDDNASLTSGLLQILQTPTGPGSQISSVAGPISDTYFNVGLAVTSGGPFVVAAVLWIA